MLIPDPLAKVGDRVAFNDALSGRPKSGEVLKAAYTCDYDKCWKWQYMVSVRGAMGNHQQLLTNEDLVLKTAPKGA